MLFRKSAEAEARILTWVGLVLLVTVLVAGLLVVINPFSSGAKDRVSLVLRTPYVGQGVAPRTAAILHGVEVGQITAVSNLPGGGVQLDADLEAEIAAGLTDSLSIDFRPANYFGITAINLVPGAGGQTLRDGMQIEVAPRGNFTMQTMLSRLGDLTAGVVTPQLVDVIDRSTRYVDGLNPLFETILMVADAVTEVQTVSTEQLLRNTTGMSVAFPGFVAGMMDLGDRFVDACMTKMPPKVDPRDRKPLDPSAEMPCNGEPVTEEFFETRLKPTLDIASKGLFRSVGLLEKTHVDELLPAVQIVKSLSDVVPGLILPEGVAQTLVELRTRLQNMYAGTPEQRALQVRIVLDSLPGVAAAIDTMGGPQ